MGPALALLLLVGGCGDPPPPPQDAKPSIEAIAAIDKVAPGGAHQIGAAEANGLWLYYPTQGQAKGTEPARPRAYVDALARRFGPVAAASLDATPLHARWGAEPVKGARPLVVFAPGAGMGGRDYRVLAEALASRGYAVAMLDPLGSPPVSTERYAEIADALAAAVATLRADPEWSPRLDLSRVVLAGHSIGGAGAVLAFGRAGQIEDRLRRGGRVRCAAIITIEIDRAARLRKARQGEHRAGAADRMAGKDDPR
ncbi:MAG: alpha/beta fold hydrolase [Sphingomonadales bacterium]|nr:MAG: alpha/beta fold hydrolase [Sphingomonadales bacterium]